MSLLTTIQNAADELGLSRPSSVADSSDDTARSFHRFAIRSAEDMRRRHCWSILRKEYEITADGSTSYALPSDLYCIIPHTFWNEDDRWRVRGAQTPEAWARRQNSWDYSSSFNAAFYISQVSAAKQIFFDPAPSTGEVLSFWYLSKNWVSDGGTLSDVWDGDSETSLLPEDIIELGAIWRMARRLGMDWQSYHQEYERALSAEQEKDEPAPVINLTPNEYYLSAVTPDTGIG